MITKDQIKKIQELKTKGYSQQKVAKKLGISRSTVQRQWGAEKILTLDDLFLYKECYECNAVIPQPKFMRSWSCPNCGVPVTWGKSWFKPQQKKVL